jgi:hypothetical protein
MGSTTDRSRRRRRALRAAAPAVGLLAAGLLVWQGSYSAFSATTDNGTESWATGQLTLTNNGGIAGAPAYLASTTAVFNETNLVPGSTRTTCLTVNSTGSLAGSLRFYRGAVTDNSVTTKLGDQLQLTITAAPTAADVLLNCAAFPAAGNVTVANNVTLNNLPTTWATAAGPVAVAAGNVKVAYKFTYTLVSTGNNANDSAMMGKTATAPFVWEIQ